MPDDSRTNESKRLVDNDEPTQNSVKALRSLVVEHRGERPFASRIGSVIRDFRPSFVFDMLDDGPQLLGRSTSPTRDFSENDLDVITDIAHQWHESIGLIEVFNEQDWIAIGTCFRVGDNEHCVLTAGHMLKALLRPGTLITQWRPLQLDGSLRKARIWFGAFSHRNTTSPFTVKKARWAHPRWDMLLLELDTSEVNTAPAASLPLTKPQSPVNEAARLCVIGFPLKRRHEARSVFDDMELDQHHLQVAPGWVTSIPLINNLPFDADEELKHVSLAHDASTLPGSSGSPVFDIDSGEVVGLHFDGGEYERDPDRRVSDPNLAVSIPLALCEDFLRVELTEGTDFQAPPPLSWIPDLPPWKPGSTIATTEGEFTSLKALTGGSMLDTVVPDRADFRDQIYRSPLLEAKDELLPSLNLADTVRDQFGESACTGFALAAAINIQLGKLERKDGLVSERMLYEMGRLNDEWLDDSAGGTSLRAVIKGFYQNGVCLDRKAPYRPGVTNWTLSIGAAHQARSITLGAYFRLQPNLLDFQLALNEVGAIIVSANLHEGWVASPDEPIKDIPFKRGHIGRHAFVILGYDRTGFIIQNSWGKQWGCWRDQPGLAHWSYADWAENLIDAWVLRLAPSTPDAFDLVPQVARYAPEDADEQQRSPILLPRLPRPRRFSLIGHSIRVEHDRIDGRGRLGMGLDSLRETALYLGSKHGRNKFRTVALFFHDPQLGDDTLLRVGAYQLKQFKRHGVYPIHIFYGLDEGYTLRLRSQEEAKRCRALLARSGEPVSAFLERRARDVLRPLYHLFHRGLRHSIEPGQPLWQTIASIVLELAPEQRICLYADGMGFGVGQAAISLIEKGLNIDNQVASLAVEHQFLVAPTCTLEELESQTTNTKSWCLPLSTRDAAVNAGFEGYWPDLAFRSGHDYPKRVDAIRHSESLEKSEAYGGTTTYASLHEAIVDAHLLNDCIELFAGAHDKSLGY